MSYVDYYKSLTGDEQSAFKKGYEAEKNNGGDYEAAVNAGKNAVSGVRNNASRAAASTQTQTQTTAQTKTPSILDTALGWISGGFNAVGSAVKSGADAALNFVADPIGTINAGKNAEEKAARQKEIDSLTPMATYTPSTVSGTGFYGTLTDATERQLYSDTYFASKGNGGDFRANMTAAQNAVEEHRKKTAADNQARIDALKKLDAESGQGNNWQYLGNSGRSVWDAMGLGNAAEKTDAQKAQERDALANAQGKRRTEAEQKRLEVQAAAQGTGNSNQETEQAAAPTAKKGYFYQVASELMNAGDTETVNNFMSKLPQIMQTVEDRGVRSLPAQYRQLYFALVKDDESFSSYNIKQNGKWADNYAAVQTYAQQELNAAQGDYQAAQDKAAQDEESALYTGYAGTIAQTEDAAKNAQAVSEGEQKARAAFDLYDKLAQQGAEALTPDEQAALQDAETIWNQFNYSRENMETYYAAMREAGEEYTAESAAALEDANTKLGAENVANIGATMGTTYQAPNWTGSLPYDAETDATKKQEMAAATLAEAQAQLEKYQGQLETAEKLGGTTLRNVQSQIDYWQKVVDKATYDQMQQDEDFERLAEAGKTRYDKSMSNAWYENGEGSGESELDKYDSWVNGAAKPYDYQLFNDAFGGTLFGASAMPDIMENKYSFLTDEEKDTFNYLKMKYLSAKSLGQDAEQYDPVKYVESLSDALDYRRSHYTTEQWASYSAQNAGTAAIGTGMGVLTNVVTTPGAIAYTGMELAGGDAPNPYNAAYTGQIISESTNETVNQMIADAAGDNSFMRWFGQLLFNAGTSGATSMANTMLFGSFGLWMQSLGAGADAARQASEAGADPTQITVMACGTAAAEFLTEKLPMDKLVENLKGGISTKSAKEFAKSLWDGIRYMAATEGFGESVAEWSEEALDRYVMAELSTHDTTVAAYIEGGMTADEAEAQYTKDVTERVLTAGLSGMLMGVGTDVLTKAVGTINYMKETDAPQELTDTLNKVAETAEKAQTTGSVDQTTHAVVVPTTEEQHNAFEAAAKGEPVGADAAQQSEDAVMQLAQEVVEGREQETGNREQENSSILNGVQMPDAQMLVKDEVRTETKGADAALEGAGNRNKEAENSAAQIAAQNNVPTGAAVNAAELAQEAAKTAVKGADAAVEETENREQGTALEDAAQNVLQKDVQGNISDATKVQEQTERATLEKIQEEARQAGQEAQAAEAAYKAAPTEENKTAADAAQTAWKNALDRADSAVKSYAETVARLQKETGADAARAEAKGTDAALKVAQDNAAQTNTATVNTAEPAQNAAKAAQEQVQGKADVKNADAANTQQDGTENIGQNVLDKVAQQDTLTDEQAAALENKLALEEGNSAEQNTEGQKNDTPATAETVQDNNQTVDDVNAETGETQETAAETATADEQKADNANAEVDETKETSGKQIKTLADIAKLTDTEKQQRTATLAKELGVSTAAEKKTGNGLVIEQAARDLDETQKANLRLVDLTAKKHGLRVVLQDGVANGRANAKYDASTDVIYLDTGAKGFYTKYLSHELVHYIRSYNETGYKALAALFDHYARNTEGYNVDERVNALIKKYEAQGKKLSYEAAKEELVADSVLDMIASKQTVRDLYVNNQSTFSKIKDWVEKQLANIKQMLQKMHKDSPEAQVMLKTQEQYETVHGIFEEVLFQADTNRRLLSKLNGKNLEGISSEYVRSIRSAFSDDGRKKSLHTLVANILKKSGDAVNNENMTTLIQTAEAVAHGEIKGSYASIVKNAGLSGWDADNTELNKAFAVLQEQTAEFSNENVLYSLKDESETAAEQEETAEDNYVKYAMKEGDERSEEDIRQEYEENVAPMTEDDEAGDDITVEHSSGQSRSERSKALDTFQETLVKQALEGKETKYGGNISDVAKLIQQETGGGISNVRANKILRTAYAQLDEALKNRTTGAEMQEAVDTAFEIARQAAEEAIENQKAQYQAVSEEDEFFEQLKATPFSLNKGQQAEVRNAYESVAAYRRAAFGSLQVVSEKTTKNQLEDMWEEISAKTGLPEDTNANDMPLALLSYVMERREAKKKAAALTDDERAAADVIAQDALLAYYGNRKSTNVQKTAKQLARENERLKAKIETLKQQAVTAKAGEKQRIDAEIQKATADLQEALREERQFSKGEAKRVDELVVQIQDERKKHEAEKKDLLKKLQKEQKKREKAKRDADQKSADLIKEEYEGVVAPLMQGEKDPNGKWTKAQQKEADERRKDNAQTVATIQDLEKAQEESVKQAAEALKSGKSKDHVARYIGSVTELARKVRELTGGDGMTEKQLASRIKGVFSGLEESKSTGETKTAVHEAIKGMTDVMRDLLADKNLGDDAQYQKVKELMRGGRFYLTKEQQDAIRSVYKSMAAFRKQSYGVLSIGTERTAKQTLADVWGKLTAIDAEAFPASTAVADMPDTLVSYLNEKRGQGVELSAEYMQLSNNAALAALTDYYRQQSGRYTAQDTDKLAHKVDRLEALTKRLNEKMERGRKDYLQSLKDYREERERTKNRQSIRRLGKELRSAIGSPTENKYVPVAYMQPILKVTEALTNADRQEINKAFLQWQNANTQMQNDPDYFNQRAFDPDLNKRIAEIIEILSRKTVDQLDANETRYVYETLRGATTALQNARKLVGKAKSKDAFEAATRGISEIRKVKGTDAHKVLQTAWNKYTTSMKSGVRAFRMFAGFAKDSVLEERAEALNEGQHKQNKIKMEASSLFRDLIADGKDKAKDRQLRKELAGFTGRNAEWVDTGVEVSYMRGKELVKEHLKITRAMRASLYMHSKNEDNMHHITVGGVTVPDMVLYKKGDLQEAYARGFTVQLTKDDVANITKGMTDYEKAWCERWMRLEPMLSKWINDTSMQLNGFKKAIVEQYFPIKTDRNFLKRDFESIVNDASIEGMGMLKARVHGSNPIMLEDITSVVNRQIDNTAKYAGLAIPVRDFNTVYNATMPGYAASMKQLMAQKWGKTGQDYIENLMADIQGARQTETTMWDTARGKFAQAKLNLNISTALKQVSGAFTITPYTGYKAMLTAMRPRLNMKDTDFIGRWTATNWIRGDNRAKTEVGGVSRDFTVLDRAPRLDWLNRMDAWTMRKIWTACEYAVDEKGSKGYDAETEAGKAYYEKVAALFDKCVDETQPSSGVMQRTDIARNPSTLTKSLTMFMGQGMQNFGVLTDTYGEMRARAADLKENASAENQAAFKEAKGKFASAVTSQVSAAVVTALCGLVAKMLLSKMNPYRDDKEEITAQSVAEGVVDDVLSNIAGTVIGGQEVYSLISSTIQGETPYDIEASGLSTVNEIYQGTAKFLNAAGAALDGEKTVEERFEKVKSAGWTLGKSIAEWFGIPAANLENLLNGVINNTKDLVNGELLSFNASMKDMSLSTGAEYMAAALNVGDMDEYTRLFNRLRKQGKTDTQIMTALKKEYRENDKRIIAAAEALNAGDLDTYEAMAGEVTSIGFAASTVRDMISTKAAALRKEAEAEDAEETEAGEYRAYTTEEALTASIQNSDGTTGLYTTAMLNDLLENGDTQAAQRVRRALIKENGQTKVDNAIQKKFKTLIVEAWEAGDATEYNRLRNILKAVGFTDSTISGWVRGTKSSSSSWSSGYKGWSSSYKGWSSGYKGWSSSYKGWNK